ncbi:hypothetical protein Tco_0707304 [Tanacetum coccineum]|uniref:Uncharacterized protein n=1 Tax=Tanacetum coccineum TaxID=301880 RepID=A0ABQ4YC37_9ASTR
MFSPIMLKIDPRFLVVLMVLHRRKSGRSNLVCNHLRSVIGIPLVVVNCGGCERILGYCPIDVGHWWLDNSATSDETAGVEEFVLTLETMALLRD